MRTHTRLGAYVAAVMAVISVSSVSAQEHPTSSLQPDAPTFVANWANGEFLLAPALSADVCPDEDPWFRAVVDGIAAATPTSVQAFVIANAWQALLGCDDAVVNGWYTRALAYATDRGASQGIAEGLAMSNRPQHVAALRAAIASDGTSDDVLRGVLLGVQKFGELPFRAEVFLTVFQRERFPQGSYTNLEQGYLLASSIGETFMADVAEAVRRQPEARRSGIILSTLVYAATEPPDSPFATSDDARRNLLRVIDEMKSLPAAARRNLDLNLGAEQRIRARLAGG